MSLGMANAHNDGDEDKVSKSCEITVSTHIEYARGMRTSNWVSDRSYYSVNNRSS